MVVFMTAYLVFKRGNSISHLETASIIERFVEGKSAKWEWDDFISTPISDRTLENIRIRCSQLRKDYPPTTTERYTNDEGLGILRQYVRQLREEK